MKPILMYGKDSVIYLEVTPKLLSKERRLGSNKNALIVENALEIKEGKKKNLRKVVCWVYGQSGHIKKKCPKCGVGSANGFYSQTNTVTCYD